MFMQLIHGPATDAQAVKDRAERWVTELGPGAAGWLGTTGGATSDGEVVLCAQFASAEAARRNSERPEQGAWWSETERLFSGPVSFSDFDDVVEIGGGSAADAGFVQVMVGHTSDPAREVKLTHQFAEVARELRPDIVGGLAGIRADGEFGQVVYFSSEDAARAGERAPMPPEWREAFEEEQKLITDIRFFDLTAPWSSAPARD